MRKRVCSIRRMVCVGGVALALIGLTGCEAQKDNGKADKNAADTTAYEVKDGEVVFTKSTGGNPLVGDSGDDGYIYGGDPSVLVDGDTVYLYTGHDTSSDDEAANAIYHIEEYLCYSTKDMVNWKAEGTVMTVDTENVVWARDSATAWASQVVKHYDKKEEKDKYYLYFCSWDNTSGGRQSIGVAVADSPTGPFEDIGEPLVQGSLTEPESNAWDDIDPTVWVETEDTGEEHRYLAWGNSRYYICELNEDMVSVKDLNGDGEITCGDTKETADILNHQSGLNSYTEAPWLYRRQKEDGEYYGPYYLFYAYGWRERMAYAVTDDLLDGEWKFGRILMLPTATSNTNHMAVFDFKGKTYFVYHNGSLPAGNGYRRSACITQLEFQEDGSIEPISETAAGLHGQLFTISPASGEGMISHEKFMNSSGDAEYPYTEVLTGVDLSSSEADGEWVINAGKADADKEAYVSIQSENKPGLYLTAHEDKTVTLSQDTDASEDTAKSQTFHTVAGLGDKRLVSFESVAWPGMYLTVQDGILCLTDGSDKEKSTFQAEKK